MGIGSSIPTAIVTNTNAKFNFSLDFSPHAEHR